MILGSTLDGSYALWFGTVGAAFDFGAAMALACPVNSRL
jgi:hypothetical protein